MSESRPASSFPQRPCPAFAVALVALAASTSPTPATAQLAADTPVRAEASAPALQLARSQTLRVQRAVGVRADGALGASTRAALRRWERRAGLPADGRPDRDVLRRMRIRVTAAQAAPAPAESRAAPAGDAADGEQAVDAALAQAGTPYRSGGERPGGFDCSGLTSWAFARAGIELPRTSFAQYGVGSAVARKDIRAGDLVFFDSAGPGASDVGIATGPTTVVSATTHGVMKHATFDAYWGGHYVGARRVPSG